MHSFHHSRGRILFEILCVLAVSASLAAASIQTGASALLLAAAVAAVFGLVHLFDLRQPKTAAAVEPHRIEVEPEVLDSLPAIPDAQAKSVPADQPRAAEMAEADTGPVEPAVPRASGGRRKGGSRKGSGRRASPRKSAEVIDFAAAEETPPAEVTMPAQTEAEVAELAPQGGVDGIASADFAEPAHVPHAPLFEAEPYVRMPRPAFGRKAG